MGANLLKPRGGVLVASVTKAATANSGTLVLPMAESYAFIIDVTAATGTSPTLDVAYQATPDGGTTWLTFARHAQITTTGRRRLNIQPTMGRGEAGSEASVADTGGALSNNTVITRKIRVLYTIAGTNPSFTFVIYVLMVPKQAGTY